MQKNILIYFSGSYGSSKYNKLHLSLFEFYVSIVF